MQNFNPLLLLQCQNGNEESWRQLFAGYYPLARWAVTHCLFDIDASVVDEISQEAMVALAGKISQIHDEGHLKRFITRVVHNKCIDYIRSHQQLFEEVPETLPAPQDPLADDSVYDALHAAVQELSEPCSTIIRSRFLEGASYEEVACKLSIGIGQIGVRLRRCLDFLKRLLADKNVSWEDTL